MPIATCFDDCEGELVLNFRSFCLAARRLRKFKIHLNTNGNRKGIAGAKPEPKIEYTVCVDAFPAKDIIITPCTHNYCNEYMRRLFKEATIDESLFPPRCCKEEIPLAISEIVLSTAELVKFKAKAREFQVKGRIYCFDPRCAAFMLPEKITLDIGT
ncbi:hypothetical protein RUND412_009537 [Rhizina undulata]